ncbi:transcriptional regulator FeaR [Pseudomonas sp. TH41]|uniref:transcriptional regulator FeaR n=1 Tax=Pseudomonas sp. TH41 TaxID=2796405 RepID=UPI001913DEFE|nr:transcriptional regulator FeaR [Pseudomonas sp. TH41]MBK5354384.1 transcriptional regulator FeaR [Pseudomonas sp. TH41]
MNNQQTELDTLENWNHAIRSLCGSYQTQLAHNRALFIGEATSKEHMGLTLAQLRTNAGLIKRTPNSDRDDDRYCFIKSQRAGYSRIVQNGVILHLAPGDMILMDSVGACEISPLGLVEQSSLRLPREAVAKSLGAKRALFGRISARCVTGRILGLLIDQLYMDKQASSAGHEECEATLNAITTLLCPALEEQDQTGCYGDSPPGNSLHLYAQRLINEGLNQSNLSPEQIAKRMKLSVRHLYRLFENQNDSVCRYILRTRLLRSASDLSNPHLGRESITSIAYKWGFMDSAHFSRAFKKQFEKSPKDYRASMLQASRFTSCGLAPTKPDTNFLLN